MERFVVEKNSVRVLAVRSERFAVVCHHCNQRLIEETMSANFVEKLAGHTNRRMQFLRRKVAWPKRALYGGGGS